MSETNPLEDCLKIRRFRVTLSVKDPLSHRRSFVQGGGYPSVGYESE